MERKREIILKTAEEIQKIYESEDLFLGKSGTCRCGMDVKRCLPDRDAIIEVIQELEQVVFQDISETTVLLGCSRNTMLGFG